MPHWETKGQELLLLLELMRARLTVCTLTCGGFQSNSQKIH